MTKKVAILFPGQGAQNESMAKGLSDAKVYELAGKILDRDTYERVLNGSMDEISKTRYAQPGIFINSMALLDQLLGQDLDIEIVAMAGLSLGEYSALCGSGIIPLEEAIGLVEKRGQIMEAGVKDKGTMLAIMKTPIETIEEIIAGIKDANPNIKNLDVANINCPGQIVVGGGFSAIDILEVACKDRGIKKVVRLNVEGPFHTQALRESADIFKEELKKINFRTGQVACKVYKNIDASNYESDDDYVDILARQMYSRVMFEDTIRNIIDQGVDTFIELGPGKTLAGFVKKIDKTKEVINIQNIEDINVFKNR